MQPLAFRASSSRLSFRTAVAIRAALEFVGIALDCRIHANAFVMSSAAGRGHAS